jgi:gliding motility-associated-like protein
MGKLLTRFSCLLLFVVSSFSPLLAQQSISCPSVNAGPNVGVTCANNCTNLTATNAAGFQTTAYGVAQIPYVPYSYTLGNAIIVNTDDIWSGVLPIPFNFCYFGNVYNQCIVGANGAISFNTGNANLGNTWPIGAPIPSPTPTDMLNSIMAPWHDIDPSVNQSGQTKSIKWQIFGTAPCRTFVVSWFNIPMFGSSCNQNVSLNATQQIVLYETTNIIETYIAQKRTCTSWNSGAAIHGIQNATGTVAYVVPGRNFPTQWAATNDAWRFVPAGPSNHTLNWFQVGNPVSLGTSSTIQVCPNNTTSYYAEVVYTNCDNSTVTVRDTVVVSSPNTMNSLNPTVVQPNCNALGSISLAPSGGTPGYTYNWSPAAGNVSTISNLNGGAYLVTVTDAGGCTFTQTFNLNPGGRPTASISASQNVGCNGGNNGSATVSVVGGTPGYTYAWSPSGGSGTIANNLTAGNYQVIVTDLTGCRDTAFVTLTQPTALNLTLPYQQNISCFGNVDGCVGAAASGGNSNYSWLWSNGSTNDTICGLAPGNYTVTLTDTTYGTGFSGGFVLCTSTASATITQPTPLAASNTVVAIPCFGGTGCINEVASGGNGNYHYLWSTGDTLASLCGLTAGTYTVTITDTSSVTAVSGGPVVLFNETFDGVLNWTLNVPTGVNGTDPNFWVINDNEGGVLPPGCGVALNGNKTLHVTSVFNPAGGAAYDAGGLCGLLFCPETNARAESPSFSSVGFNNLTLTFDFISAGDALLDNASVYYNAGAGWLLLNPSIKTVNCLSGQGQWTGFSAALPATCNNNPNVRVAINWTNNDDALGSDPSVAINNLRVTAPGSLTGSPVFCTIIDTITLTQPTQLVTTSRGHDLTCFGAADGSVVVTYTGATPTYNVLWSNSGTADSLSGLAAGTYGVTVTDANGCTSTQSVNIVQPAQIVTGTSMTAVSCNGGADGCAIVTATGGPSGVFSFLWSNGATNDTICGLAAGTYFVTVTDTTGGGGTSNVTVYSEDFDPAPAWTLNVPTGPNGADPNFWVMNDNEGGVLPPGCGVALNGDNTLHVTSVFNPGGGAAYDAGGLCGLLFCPETNSRAESPVINTTGFNNLTLNFDFISLGDALIDNASVWYNDGTGWTMLSPSIKSGTCLSGQGRWTGNSIALPASCWNNPAVRIGFNWTNNDDGAGSDPSVAINNVTITSSITITNAVSCTAIDTITVLQPTPLTVTVSRTNAFCGQTNGTATATPAGGNGGYTYTWSTVPVQTTATATGLIPGAYSVTVTDQLGCTVVGNVTILNIPGPTLTLGTVTNVSCFGGNNGTASASTSGGTAPITIRWNTIPLQIGSTATGLAAGTYLVWATDSAGCADTIQFQVTQPTVLAGTVSTVGAVCNLANGSATVTPNGGTTPYSYNWSNGQTSATATSLPGGPVTVTVTDANGCQIVRNANIAQAGSPILALVGFNDINCFGGNDGSVTVSASAGVGPYTYAWNTTPVQNSATASNLTAGTYTVTVTDQNGCRDNLTITLSQPTQLTGTVIVTPNGCNLTVPNGTAGVVAQGGVPPYGYTWGTVPVQTGPYATGLAPGTYSVTINDAHGCLLVLSGTVLQIPSPIVTAGPDGTFCEGDGGVLLSAVGSSGTPGYYYNWWCANPPCGLDSINDNDPLANPTSSQWYYVQVTDINGCTSNIDSAYVNVLPKPIVDAGPDIILCGDQAPCQILTPTITGAPGPYTYQWAPTAGLNNATILNPCARPDTTTIYTLVVTAGNGCTSDYTTTDTLSTVTVNVNPIPVANAGPDRDICYGDTTVLQGLATNAGPLYTFEWTPSHDLSDSSVANPLAYPPLTTDYTLVVWSNGCPSYGDTATVNVHTIPTVDAGWDREICPLQDTLLDAQAWGDSTATYTFLWTPGTGIVGSATVEDLQIAPGATTTYYVIATSSWGCESEPDSATVYVRPAPQADAGPNVTICPGDSVQLQGGYFYTTTDSAVAGQWYYGWSPATTMNDSTLEDPTVWPSVSTWYNLEIRYSVCSSLDSVLVTVGANSIAQVMPDTTVICRGDSVLIDASGSVGNTFTWIPTTGLGNPNSLTPLAAPSATTTYTLVMGSGGCTDSATFTLAVLPKPDAAYLSSLTDGCAPLTVSFMETASGGLSYVWNFGDGTPVSNLPTPTHVFTEPGTYNVSLTVAAPGGCTDEVNSIFVNATPGPIADFTSSPTFPVQMSFPNTTVSFQDLSAGANQWTWNFGDGVISTSANPAHTYSQEGEFFVTLTVHSPEGCAAEVTHGPYIVMTPDLFIPNVFSPNGDGVNDFFQVQYTGDQPFNCAVFDRWGVKLWQTNNKTATWDGKDLNGAEVPEGVYFYTAKVGNRDFNNNLTLMR